jgi:uncharacterized damage-inducible protein DinB
MHKEITKRAIQHFRENTERIIKCLDMLTEEDIWKRPNASSNSVGNQVLHLCGNITQYVISSLGQREDKRERDKEFATTSGYSLSQLIKMLSDTTSEAIMVFETTTPEELMRVRQVQGFTYTGIAVVMHVVEHYSYHTGQIAFWTKLLKDTSLGFYDNIDLNVKNQD